MPSLIATLTCIAWEIDFTKFRISYIIYDTYVNFSSKTNNSVKGQFPSSSKS